MRWKCRGCRNQFSVKVGTIFEDSPLSLSKWVPAVWVIVNAKNGVSSCELARSLGVTQKANRETGVLRLIFIAIAKPFKGVFAARNIGGVAMRPHCCLVLREACGPCEFLASLGLGLPAQLREQQFEIMRTRRVGPLNDNQVFAVQLNPKRRVYGERENPFAVFGSSYNPGCLVKEIRHFIDTARINRAGHRSSFSACSLSAASYIPPHAAESPLSARSKSVSSRLSNAQTGAALALWRRSFGNA